MATRYDYKVFPETWKGRAMLALGFLAGPPIIFLYFYAYILIASEGSSVPSGLAGGPCAPSSYPECLEAQTELVDGSIPTCTGLQVCIAPLGQVSPELVRHLTEHFRQQYGLSLYILTPTAIPPDLINDRRQQVDAYDLVDLLDRQFVIPGLAPSAVVIGVTPVDIYISTSTWRYAFGLRSSVSVISTTRMDPAAYGELPDDELLNSRVRKLLSKYIGFLYYNLDLSADPKSPMFDNILSPDDLDRMDEPLPVEDAR
ncbi:MAG: hypothetical protein ABIU97_10070 [Dehalococcoidia bacterium]